MVTSTFYSSKKAFSSSKYVRKFLITFSVPRKSDLQREEFLIIGKPSWFDLKNYGLELLRLTTYNSACNDFDHGFQPDGLLAYWQFLLENV
jgi:hypothetical protein